jgi:flagellar hook-associated protein 1 FlgK
MSQDATGAISYTVGSSALTLSGGSLAGNQQAMTAAISTGSTLDTIANSLSSTVNSAQTNGAAQDGSAGQAMFSGTGAAGSRWRSPRAARSPRRLRVRPPTAPMAATSRR